MLPRLGFAQPLQGPVVCTEQAGAQVLERACLRAIRLGQCQGPERRSQRHVRERRAAGAFEMRGQYRGQDCVPAKPGSKFRSGKTCEPPSSVPAEEAAECDVADPIEL